MFTKFTFVIITVKFIIFLINIIIVNGKINLKINNI